jgi:hypothetical protein
VFRRTVCSLLSLVAFPACSFDTSGLPPPDAVRLDRPDLARSELALPDRGGEAAASVCQGKPDGARVCRFEGAEPVGASGACQGGSFVLKRYCFAEAPCAGGLCTPAAPDGCGGSGVCSPGKLCAGFVNAGSIVTACVTANEKNGSGEPGAACTAGSACRSGHCTGAGTCFQPCSKVTDTCPPGTACASTTIVEGLEHTVSSCLKAAADGGAPRPPDLGPADQTSSE